MEFGQRLLPASSRQYNLFSFSKKSPRDKAGAYFLFLVFRYIFQHFGPILRMCLHQPEQCMDAMVGLLAESGVKLLQQGEILHCIERKAKVQPPFQFIGQRKQANAERFGMCIEINRNVLYVQFFLCSGGAGHRQSSARQTSPNEI